MTVVGHDNITENDFEAALEAQLATMATKSAHCHHHGGGLQHDKQLGGNRLYKDDELVGGLGIPQRDIALGARR